MRRDEWKGKVGWYISLELSSSSSFLLNPCPLHAWTSRHDSFIQNFDSIIDSENFASEHEDQRTWMAVINYASKSFLLIFVTVKRFKETNYGNLILNTKLWEKFIIIIQRIFKNKTYVRTSKETGYGTENK